MHPIVQVVTRRGCRPSADPDGVPARTANTTLPMCWMYSLSASSLPEFLLQGDELLGSFMKAMKKSPPSRVPRYRVDAIGERVPRRRSRSPCFPRDWPARM